MKRGPDLTVRMALDRAAETIGGKFGAQPAVEGAIRKTLGDTYNNLGLYGPAQVQLESAVSLLSASLGENHQDTLFVPIHVFVRVRIATRDAPRYDSAATHPAAVNARVLMTSPFWKSFSAPAATRGTQTSSPKRPT